MSKLENILNNLPRHWNTARTSRLATIVNAIAEEMKLQGELINRIDNANGIDTATGRDLDTRWGKMLNIQRYYGESDEDYRTRLKMSISILVGGTADAIKFAVCNILGTNSDIEDVSPKVQVIDAWEYTPFIVKDSYINEDTINDTMYTGKADKPMYGHTVCIVNIDDVYNTNAVMSMITQVVNNVKASGVYVHFIFVIAYHEEYDITKTDVIDQGHNVNKNDGNIIANIDGVCQYKGATMEDRMYDDHYYLRPPRGDILNNGITNNFDIYIDGVDDNNEQMVLSREFDDVYINNTLEYYRSTTVSYSDTDIAELHGHEYILDGIQLLDEYEYIFDRDNPYINYGILNHDIIISPTSSHADVLLLYDEEVYTHNITYDTNIHIISDGRLDDGVTSNLSELNNADLSDGSESSIICTKLKSNMNIGLADEYECTLINNPNQALHADVLSLHDEEIYTHDVTYDTKAHIVKDSNLDDGVTLNSSELNNTSLSDGSESSIICTELESGMDTIKQDGKPDIIINY